MTSQTKRGQNTNNNFFIEMFTANSGLSSKRVCGFLGWVVSLLIAIYCTLMGIPAPDITEVIVFSSIMLLGVDSVTSIWKGRKSTTKPTKPQ